MPNAVGDIYELVIVQSLHGQVLNTVRHYRVKSVQPGQLNTPRSFIETRLIAACSEIFDTMKTVLSEEWSIVGVKAQYIYPEQRSAGVISSAQNGAGLVEQSSLPSSCCAVIRQRTAFAGRAFRGRNYIAGIPVTVEDDSKISAAFQNQLEALGFNLRKNQTVSDQLGQEILEVDGVLFNKGTGESSDLVSGFVDPIIRTQRRRQVGKGV